MSRPSRSLRRAIAPALRASVALVCISLHLVSVAHFVLMRHEVCAEHGETVHASGEHAHLSVLATDATDQTRGSVEGGQDTSSHPEHAHCDAANSHRDQAYVAPADLAIAAGPASLSAERPRGTTASATSISRLSLAPKVSPPA